jgi:predicted 3-demethylubiquinone-9 3-methyltransferase (glyoxalase superfamily)
MATLQKITPHLWFDNQAEEAAKFYVSIFRDSSVTRVSHYGKEGFEIHGRPDGSVMTVEFNLEGQNFLALNGGPHFKFNEAISFMISCKTQDEIDHYWNKLTEGGDKRSQQCGWLKDKFGLSWQVVPEQLGQMMADKDSARIARVTKAFMKMKKLDLAELQNAFAGKEYSK